MILYTQLTPTLIIIIIIKGIYTVQVRKLQCN